MPTDTQGVSSADFLDTRHDPWLALAAFAIACLASYVALDLARRVRTPDRRAAITWGVSGSLVMGTGIWSMHFVAMLGYDAGMPLGYAVGPTLWSWLAGVLAAAIALGVAARERSSLTGLGLAAGSMAGGICAMHYIGMAALDMAPGIVWHRGWVLTSVGVALAASAAALGIMQALRALRGRALRWAQLGSALLMGLAISGLHYAGMNAASLPAGAVCLSVGGLGGDALAWVVGGATVLLLAAALLSSALDARIKAREQRLARSLQDANAELQTANDRLQRLAFIDALTGLSNRALFDDRLAHAVARLARPPSAPASGRGTQAAPRLAVLLLNLDGFKPLNDSLGRAAGDQLLREVAARLSRETREADTLARLGGDEFVLLLEGLTSPAEAVLAAERLLAALRHPVKLQGREVAVAASVGLALHPDHGAGDRLLGCAEAALQSAKRAGGSTYALYEAAMASDAGEQVWLGQALRGAAERGELSLHYQPKIESATGGVHGVEALLRWRHAERGPISPAVFIPTAERFGLIGGIGNWVIDAACAQLAQWRAEGLGDLHLAINLSPHQLRQPDLVARIRQALDRHGLAADRLVCEITESTMMENIDTDRLVLDELAGMGVVLSIDDFGTGYSSLAYLRRLPVRQLKIDRSLVKDIDRDAGARAVLDAVVRLSHALNLEVVAEGVETAAQQQQLTAIGCDLLQGFLLARPMPAEDLPGWVRAWRAAAAARAQAMRADAPADVSVEVPASAETV